MRDKIVSFSTSISVAAFNVSETNLRIGIDP